MTWQKQEKVFLIHITICVPSDHHEMKYAPLRHPVPAREQRRHVAYVTKHKNKRESSLDLLRLPWPHPSEEGIHIFNKCRGPKACIRAYLVEAYVKRETDMEEGLQSLNDNKIAQLLTFPASGIYSSKRCTAARVTRTDDHAVEFEF